MAAPSPISGRRRRQDVEDADRRLLRRRHLDFLARHGVRVHAILHLGDPPPDHSQDEQTRHPLGEGVERCPQQTPGRSLRFRVI